MIDSKTAGSRYATRVRIASPEGSAYDGRVGIVVELPATAGCLRVRLFATRHSPEVTLPFGLSEIKEIKA